MCYAVLVMSKSAVMVQNSKLNQYHNSTYKSIGMCTLYNTDNSSIMLTVDVRSAEVCIVV